MLSLLQSADHSIIKAIGTPFPETPPVSPQWSFHDGVLGILPQRQNCVYRSGGDVVPSHHGANAQVSPETHFQLEPSRKPPSHGPSSLFPPVHTNGDEARESKTNQFSALLVIDARSPFSLNAKARAFAREIGSELPPSRYQCPFPPSSTRHCTG